MALKSIYLLIIALFISIPFWGQKISVKFGVIEETDLKMDVYEPDTSAVAVVLSKIGNFYQGNRTYLLRRVKILKKNGLYLADFFCQGGSGVVIKGATYNIEEGTIVKDELKSESIYKERITDNYYRYRVAMPNAKIGSVLDIEISGLSWPNQYAFQEDIPIKHVELSLSKNLEIGYKDIMIRPKSVSYPHGITYSCDTVPAFKEEPYMNSAQSYIAEFEILSTYWDGKNKSYTDEWGDINSQLLRSPYFGGPLSNLDGFLSNIEEEINLRYSSPLDKLNAAYQAIKVVKWNGKQSLYASSNALINVFKKGMGNSTDINLMLYRLLIDLKINATLIVLSTRENGELSLYYPSDLNLNYTVVGAQIGEKIYLLDASEKYLPLGLLPERCLNNRGRAVNNDDGYWVSLIPEKGDKRVVQYELKLNTDLKFVGSMVQTFVDYAAYQFRQSIAEYASNEGYISQSEQINPGLLIKDCTICNLDSVNSPATVRYNIEVNGKAEKINDMIVINPFMFEQIKENPFKLEQRLYPIDFAYTRDKTVSINIKIPEGYTVVEIPKPLKMVTPENSMIALISITSLKQEINIVYRLQIKKINFSPDEYVYIKELYNQIIKKQLETIILKPIH